MAKGSVHGLFTRLGGHFRWGAESNHGVNEQLLDAVALVAKYLKTSYVAKSHGGYERYDDDKVCVELDTYVPNLAVYVKRGNAQELVLHFNYGGFAQKYRPGKWQQYIMNVLLPRAEEAFYAELDYREDEVRQRHHEDFGPVDDDDVFTELA